MRSVFFLIPMVSVAATIPADVSGVRPGPIAVAATAESITVRWPDEASRIWTAEFSLNTETPLIKAITIGSTAVARNAYSQYWAYTVKRRGRPQSNRS